MPAPAITPPMNPKATNDTSVTPLDPIRTETVLSRLPIHNLSKKGKVDIQIIKKNAHGEVDLRWKVIPNPTIGEPRQLAYKLDTLVINRRLDEARRPIPEIIYLGSLRDIARELDLGNDTPAVKKALRQNAHLVLVVKIKYLDKDGVQRVAEFENTRYGVIFTGEQLPNGSKADGVYLTLNAPYRQVLNNAPVRPLDYNYLKVLTPAAQRFYEIVSYRMFAAIKFKHTHAKLPYSEYCTYSAQQRYLDFNHVKKQMYKVHKPHLTSGYIQNVSFKAATDDDGNPDWLMCYVPGPKARAEFRTFNGTHAKAIFTTAQESLSPLEPAEASAPDDAQDLVQYFHKRFHDTDIAPLAPKDLEFAAALIAQYGTEKARFVVEYSQEAAATTKYSPEMLIGIRKYAEAAIKKFDVREEQRAQEKRKAREAELKDQYERYLDQEIERITSTMSPEELADVESSIRADLAAKGIKQFVLDREIHIKRDNQLAARAGVLPFEEWRKQQA
jgi:hypothetical protein